MRQLATASLLVALAACASPGSNLVPGLATEADVERVMGPSADRREQKGGAGVRYYSTLPAGRAMDAARFGRDGKLIAIEQRLTRAYTKQLVPGKSTKDDTRDLIGPPYRIQSYPQISSEVW